jgi:serine/threonine protein phosphatase PrpC
VTAVLTCPHCANPGEDADRFCEACGGEMRPIAAPPRSLTSAALSDRCAYCESAAASADGYCDACGRRRSASKDRAELQLPRLAAVTDRGHRKHHNEDAVSIGRHPQGNAAIVCDGVSSTPHADAAAQAAVDAGMAAMLEALDAGEPARGVTAAAFSSARAAVAEIDSPTPAAAPSCTYVSGLVAKDAITVAWVGDSRAYWIPEAGDPRCLTVDDARADIEGAPLTRWVGADAEVAHPQVTAVYRPEPGCLVLCSDGLSRYLAQPSDLSIVLDLPPSVAAQRLTELALTSGGVDNIAVAVLAFPPVPGEEL